MIRAEYSIDAGEWQIVEPVGQISDSKTESYDFQVPQDSAGQATARHKAVAHPSSTTQEHTIVVRAYDRFDNMGSAKVVVNGPAAR